MRIATRLTLLFVALTFLVALTVGWFAVVMSSRAQYATLDSSINSVVASGLRNPNTALSNALYVVQRDGFDLTLDVVDPSGEITQVNAASTPLRANPTVSDVRNSLSQIATEENLPGFVIRSLNVGGGDYLVVAGSTAGITKQNQHLALVVASAAVVVALLGLFLARLVMRRDLRTMERLIEFAGHVASGDETSQVPVDRGSKDLRELREALGVMVAALRERIEVEARSSRAMQQFIDDASHELRTPLTVVKGYNELMVGGSMSPEQQQRALQRVQREVQRREELVRDLLLLAQVREAPHHAEEIINLSDVVRARMSDFVQEHPQRDARVEVNDGVLIRARPEFLDRLVGNALTNILRHTPESAPLRVSLRRVDDAVLLTVEDGGPGLPVYGVRPQRFQRFDESRSRETGGSGLGMSIMADVAELLGGSLTTQRSELGGLALRFRLPVAGKDVYSTTSSPLTSSATT
ncbi:MAG: sensor histidine kinase [Acidimicrobiales bacterium]